MKERIHNLEAVGITDIVPKQDIILEEKPVVNAAIEKKQPIFQQFVKRREVFAKKSPARFADDVFFSVRHHLCHLLANSADHSAPRTLQFRKLCFDDVGLLAAFKMLPALANPLLAFENEIGELIADFDSEEFQQGQAKHKINVDIFVELGLSDGALHEVSEQFAKGGMVRVLHGPQFSAGDVGAFGVLTDEVKQVLTRRLDEPWTQEHIVVDVVHADGQRPHGDRGVVALEFDPGRFCLTGRENTVDHDLAGKALFNVAAAARRSKNWRGGSG